MSAIFWAPFRCLITWTIVNTVFSFTRQLNNILRDDILNDWRKFVLLRMHGQFSLLHVRHYLNILNNYIYLDVRTRLFYLAWTIVASFTCQLKWFSYFCLGKSEISRFPFGKVNTCMLITILFNSGLLHDVGYALNFTVALLYKLPQYAPPPRWCTVIQYQFLDICIQND